MPMFSLNTLQKNQKARASLTFSGKKENIGPKWVKVNCFAPLRQGVTEQSKINIINLWESGLAG